MALLLGIDIGTSYCKAGIYTETGKIIDIKKVKTKTYSNDKGWSWCESKDIWLSVTSLLQSILNNIDPVQINGLSVASMGEAGIPIDINGNPTYPIIAWFDQRSLPQSRRLEKMIGRDKIFNITGLDINPIFSVPKLLWLKDNEPEAFNKTAKWLSITDYINYKLTGNIVTNYSIASRTLALDIIKKNWSDSLLNLVGLNSNLFPDLKSSHAIIGKVTRSASIETGLLSGTPVANGGHDHFCGSFASGILLGNNLLDSSGTAESIHTLLNNTIPPLDKFRGFRIGRYLDSQKYYIVGGLVASGGAIDWLKKRIASVHDWTEIPEELIEIDYHILDKKAENTEPGAGGLLFLPHIRGGGAPNWDPESRGVLIGLKSAHTSPEIMRALIEGLCFEAKRIIEAMDKIVDHPIEKLTAVGGGTNSQFWQQTKANVTGLPVEIPNIKEATAMGAAMLAGIGTGVYDDMISASQTTYRIKKYYKPNLELTSFYRDVYKTYSKLYPTLKEINRELGGIDRNNRYFKNIG